MIDENNKEILDDLVRENPKVKELTYIELGILLNVMGFNIDWARLSDAHEYLGGYGNEEKDKAIKKKYGIKDWPDTSSEIDVPKIKKI